MQSFYQKDMKKLITGWLMLLTLPLFTVTAQEDLLPVLVRPDSLPATHDKALFLNIYNNNFLFDAEYFSPLEDGFTWIGLQFQPELSFQLDSHFLIHGGVYMLKYSGKAKSSDIRPVFSITYKFNRTVSLVMGTLYGSLNHRLPLPLYQYDRTMYNYPEEGVQALVHTPWLEGDYWLQWRHFILPGDPYQEELVFGTSSLFRLTPGERDWRFSIPVYTLVNHRGGQIDTSPEPVHTFGNMAAGVRVNRQLSGRLFQDLVMQVTGYDYFDLSGTPLFDFSSGWAVQPQVEISGKSLSLQAGYWYGHNFYSLLGEPLFASVSEKSYPDVYPGRSLLTMKVQYQRNLTRGVNIFVYGNGFFDTGLGEFDYNLGLQLLFNMDFWLGKVKEDKRQK